LIFYLKKLKESWEVFIEQRTLARFRLRISFSWNDKFDRYLKICKKGMMTNGQSIFPKL
jgi:hypothetical protein